MHPHQYSQLISAKGDKGNTAECFQQKSWNNWTLTCKTPNLDTNLIPLQKLTQNESLA